jgi:hypothetical protein
MGAQPRIERIQHDAGLDHRARALGVHLEHLVQVLGVVDDQGLADRLAALRAAGAARQDGYPFVRCDGERAARGLLGARHDDAYRRDLIDRRISSVPAAACCIEQNLRVERLRQARGQARPGQPRESNRRGWSVHRAK